MKSTDKVQQEEIIEFLKQQQKNYDEAFIHLIDGASNGLYVIHEDQIAFSEKAKSLLNIDDDVSLKLFYEGINLQDRMILMNILKDSEEKNSTYEAIYRYKLDEKEMIWVKEYGLFCNKNHRIAMITNYSEHINQSKEIHRLAYYDGLTKMKNQNYFQKDCELLIKYKVPFSLLLIDLNSFKVINEDFGHSLGDYVLKTFADHLNDMLKASYDFDLYRLAGDEFSIIFPYIVDKEEIKGILDKIFHEFSHPLLINDYRITVTPSIGISIFPDDSLDLKTLMKYAEISLFRSKTNEYENYSFFNYDYYLSLLEEQAIEQYIKSLIENNEITLNYQPIYNLESNEVVGFEALLDSYKKEFNSKQIFDTALKTNLIVLLDQYIIKKVISDIKKLNDKTRKNLRFTINLTPKTIEYFDIYGYIKKMLETYQIDGSSIGIEITEQYYVEDETKLNVLIEKLQALGIKIYLDDFGMGYSSVRNITYLHYDNIKLDRRLINTVKNNRKCHLFFKSILQFSQDLHCDLIFEGIETEEQIDYIKSLGGKLIQGYYISKPIGINDAIKLVTR